MRLRLYHHRDGARIAYREAGTGPPLALLHSALLSHREWEPVVGELSDRFRLVLPDLPLHGDSEHDPQRPYTPEWLAEVLCGFLAETCGPRPLVGAHELGASLLLRAVLSGGIAPARMVLMPNAMHRRTPRHPRERAVAAALRVGSVPGLDWTVSHATRALFRPVLGERMTVTGNPAARDLIRHAADGVAGSAERARAWAKAAAGWPVAPLELEAAYARLDMPVLLLWADSDRAHPLEIAEEAFGKLPDAQLRVLGRTGFLIAYDDPVGVAREIVAFCRPPLPRPGASV